MSERSIKGLHITDGLSEIPAATLDMLRKTRLKPLLSMEEFEAALPVTMALNGFLVVPESLIFGTNVEMNYSRSGVQRRFKLGAIPPDVLEEMLCRNPGIKISDIVKPEEAEQLGENFRILMGFVIRGGQSKAA